MRKITWYLNFYFFSILCFGLMGRSSTSLRSDGLPIKSASGLCLGQRLVIPTTKDLKEAPADEVVHRFAQTLAEKARGNDQATTQEKISFLSELQACLKIKDIPTVQALCFIEAKELGKELPEYAMSEDAMNLLLTDRALNLTQAYETL